MNCILTNELHIDEWTSQLINGLDQLTNYRKFAPRLEHIFLVDGGAEHSEDSRMPSKYSKCKSRGLARTHKAYGLQNASKSPHAPLRPADPHPGELKRSFLGI